MKLNEHISRKVYKYNSDISKDIKDIDENPLFLPWLTGEVTHGHTPKTITDLHISTMSLDVSHSFDDTVLITTTIVYEQWLTALKINFRIFYFRQCFHIGNFVRTISKMRTLSLKSVNKHSLLSQQQYWQALANSIHKRTRKQWLIKIVLHNLWLNEWLQIITSCIIIRYVTYKTIFRNA